MILVKKKVISSRIWTEAYSERGMWQPGMAIVDFTNPEACAWFKGLLKKLFDMGVNNIKTDFGERIPTKVKYYDGF